MRKSIILLLAAVTIVAAGCGSGGKPPAGFSISDGWVTTPSGLRFKDVTIGTGYPPIKKGDNIEVYYKGWLDDGTVFDENKKEGGKPFAFKIGGGQVIDGWEQGFIGLRRGAITELIIPPSLGYGDQGQGSIPPNSTLYFRVEIITVY